MTGRTLGVVLGAAIVAAAWPTPAQATYPGYNGRLAFGMNRNGNVDIWSAAPRGRPMRRLTEDPAFDACAAYSADGRQIAFCSERTGRSEIWAMDQFGNDERQVTRLAGFASFPDWSPDGSRLTLTWTAERGAPADIYEVRADGTGLRRLTAGGDNRWSASSPDGTKIAFVSRRTGQSQVWVMDADGTDQRQLTFADAGHDQLPDWSPDGTRIAYQQVNAPGDGDIWVMDADGGNPRQLTSGFADDYAPSWSPRGDRIAFGRGLGGGDWPVYTINADGTNPHRFSFLRPADTFAPAWQPLVF